MNRRININERERTETAVLRSASLVGDTAPARVMLAPWGTVETANGDFVLDQESVRLAVEAFEEHGTDLPIDFEHQTLGGTFASPTGQAPAAGWIKRLFGEPGTGLWAEIEWTQPGRDLVAGKQYRYLSPVAIIRKSDRKLVAIHSAALTNKPAIVGMQPIVNATRIQVGSDEATERRSDEEVFVSVPRLSGSGRIEHCRAATHESACNSLELLRAELQLPLESDVEEVLVAAGNRIFKMREDDRRRRMADRVQQAMRCGKLVEAQRAWAEELACRDEALFEEWFRGARGCHSRIHRPAAVEPPVGGVALIA